jgi:ubiquinone/menaquinone biosynthesis C-methylase UbiE
MKNSTHAKRSDYKKVWTDLSNDFEKAVRHVTGTATEEELVESGKFDANRILNHTRTTNHDDVLEIGCGVGRIGLEYSKHCNSWTGADISSNMLAFANQRLEELKNVEFKELSDCNLSIFPDNSFDVIYCSVVFMHLDEWDRYNYILESYRVLKNEGRLYFDNFNIQSPEGWKTFVEHKKIPAQFRPAHISKSSSVNEFEAYLENSSFDALRSDVISDGQWVVGLGFKN